jgi:hypothetical protein
MTQFVILRSFSVWRRKVRVLHFYPATSSHGARIEEVAIHIPLHGVEARERKMNRGNSHIYRPECVVQVKITLRGECYIRSLTDMRAVGSETNVYLTTFETGRTVTSAICYHAKIIH